MRQYFGGLAVVGAVVLSGCGPDYQDQRPPVGELHPQDRGLQSKDVLACSDQLTADLMALPELQANKYQLTLVVDRMDDKTTGRDFAGNYDIFLERLRSNISEQGHGRVRLIENKAKFEDIRSRELYQANPDEFGQGGGAAAGGSAPTQPNYALYGKAYDMPNRYSNYYYLEFNVVDLRSREQIWSRKYEVKVQR